MKYCKKMFNYRNNFTKETYEKDDFLRYFNTLLTNYYTKYIDASDCFTLLITILQNIVENPENEKYQRLKRGQNTVVNGKTVLGGRVYNFLTGRPEGTQILIMLGFREVCFEMSLHWILAYKDRISFYPDVITLIASKMDFVEKKKIKEEQAALQLVEKEKQRIEAIKLQLKGDRLERKDKHWYWH